MKCCVVGCGAAGIIASRHLKAHCVEFDAYEMTDDIGGIWVYSEKETDNNGTPVHTVMYKNLRTNLPKEMMEFEGVKHESNISFLSPQEVHQYLKNVVNKYNLVNHIKLGHMVTRIIYDKNKWKVCVKNMESKEDLTAIYDAVMVCNGHYFKPNLPNVEGMNDFKGIQMHSKKYRESSIFKDKNLLVIGLGSSGNDIAEDSSRQAKKVFLSHHYNNFSSNLIEKEIVPKPDVERINQNSVTFIDGSTENIDAIIYCTGYCYDFPFLDESCDISIHGNYVSPLYKQFINLRHPTMAFIGLTFKSFLFPLFEVQVKAFINVLLKNTSIPDEQTMLAELEQFENHKLKKGWPKRKYHQIENIRDYIKEVASVGNLPDIPSVLYKIYDYNTQQRSKNLPDYRKYVYNITDNDNFTVEFVE